MEHLDICEREDEGGRTPADTRKRKRGRMVKCKASSEEIIKSWKIYKPFIKLSKIHKSRC